MRKIVLKVVMSLIGFIFLFSACCLDSKKWFLFLIICILSGSLLYLFAYANNWIYKK